MDNKKQRDIEKDFYNCLGAYKNVSEIMKSIENLRIIDSDTEEKRILKQAQIDDILVQLGRIGELAYKYLLKLKQIQIYPDQSYEQFSQTEQIYKNGLITDLTNKGLIPPKEAETIKSFNDENKQKFHNFMYLHLLLSALTPMTIENFEKMINYRIQSRIVARALHNMSKEEREEEIENGSYCQLLLFPNLIWNDNFYINTEKMDRLISSIKDKASTSGDIFTRFRYYSNNHNNVQFNVDDTKRINFYMGSLVKFISGVHRNHNDLLTPAESIHAHDMSENYKFAVARKDTDSIIDTFVNDDSLTLCKKLFSGYSVEELKRIEELCKKYDFLSLTVVDSGISPEKLEVLHNKGIDSEERLQEYLFDARTIGEDQKLEIDGLAPNINRGNSR